ncbi:hypothetical protein D9M71_391400 [compost metagenome]
MLGEGRRAYGAEHPSGAGVAARGGGEELAGGVAAVAGVGERFQGLDLAAMVARRQRHLGQGRPAGAPVGEEAPLHAVRPGEGVQDADLPRQRWQGGIDFGKRGGHGGYLMRYLKA